MEMPDVGVAVSSGAVGSIVGALVTLWNAKRTQPRKIDPTPLPVTTEKTPKYLTVQEFNKHVEDNARDHENIFARLNANDKQTSKLEGILEGIREDLSAIKNKLFKTR